MRKMLNEGNQMHNFIPCLRTIVIPFYYGSGSGSGTVFNYDSGSNFLARYGSGSASQKVKVPTVKVPVHKNAGKKAIFKTPLTPKG
jgi:hypothetical protein